MDPRVIQNVAISNAAAAPDALNIVFKLHHQLLRFPHFNVDPSISPYCSRIALLNIICY
jgi:hypothetical protein